MEKREGKNNSATKQTCFPWKHILVIFDYLESNSLLSNYLISSNHLSQVARKRMNSLGSEQAACKHVLLPSKSCSVKFFILWLYCRGVTECSCAQIQSKKPRPHNREVRFCISITPEQCHKKTYEQLNSCC